MFCRVGYGRTSPEEDHMLLLKADIMLAMRGTRMILSYMIMVIQTDHKMFIIC